MIADKAIAAARDSMVAELLARRIIQTPAIERAFRTVPRHAFLPQPFVLRTNPLLTDMVETLDPCRVYSDTLVSINREKNIHCGLPSVVATQIERLAPGEGMRVLHIGTGSGYYTAILAELVGERGSVVGVEYEPDLVKMSAAHLARAGYTNATVLDGDGASGVPDAAPFDRIIVCAGCADIASAWVLQLGDDGRLVFPLCHAGVVGPMITSGVLLTVHKLDERLSGEILGPVLFAAMQGALAPGGNPEAFADAWQRWFALEEFLRAELPIRIVMKPAETPAPQPSSVPWLLETRNAIMWVEPN
jgi:protein-L-isoaspartate(D-aspartate) O-methyltransferase